MKADALKSLKKKIEKALLQIRPFLVEDGGDVQLVEITDDLRNGDSELLKSIASNVKEWAGNWEAVWDNILLRAKIKQALVDYSINTGRPELLEAEFVVRANDMFHIILESVKNETGFLNSEKIYTEWISWLEKNAGKSNK